MDKSSSRNMKRGVIVRKSPVHGRGVFATRDLGRGVVIDRGPVVPCSNNDGGQFIATYAFDVSTHGGIALGLVSLCNHGSPNSEIEIDDESLTYRLRTTRMISKGSEVLIDYGQEYWEGR